MVVGWIESHRIVSGNVRATYRTLTPWASLIGKESLQLCVLRFGLLRDRNIRVGVLPEGEEVLISGERPEAGSIGVCLSAKKKDAKIEKKMNNPVPDVSGTTAEARMAIARPASLISSSTPHSSSEPPSSAWFPDFLSASGSEIFDHPGSHHTPCGR
jgi:hypothetical protein